MNVNAKGTIGLIKVIDDLIMKGYHVFPPFDDYCPVDLIVMSEAGKTARLQVKYRTPNVRKTETKRYFFEAVSVVNGKRVPIDRSLIDYWAVYLSEHDIVKYIPISAMAGKGSLMINPAVDYGKLEL